MPFNRPAALRKIHALGRALGFDHEQLQDIASTFFRIEREKISLGKLSNNQYAQLIGHLSGQAPQQPIQIKNAATHRQIWKIRQLATKLGMDENPERLPGFIQRQTRCRVVEELTTWQASKVIEGLKNLLQEPKE